MRYFYEFAFAIALLFPLSEAAHAQAETTYVASNNGDDSHNCSRVSPCLSFTRAIDVADSGGEVRCIDQLGAFLIGTGVTITKSITIDCRGLYGSVQRDNVGGNDIGFIINGAGINVTLRGLNISTSEGEPARIGIDIRQAANVLVQDCVIHGFTGADAVGIKLSNTTPTNVDVFDTTITGNGTASLGGGISVAPGSGGSARVTLRHVQLDNNFNGLNVDTTTSSATTRVIVSDSSLTGNTNNGINLASSGPVDMTVERSVVSNNLRGIKSLGASATVRIGNSTITGNGAGVQNLGGVMTSYKNNIITGNGQNGTPLAAATDD